jgi:hypothetical protein
MTDQINQIVRATGAITTSPVKKLDLRVAKIPGFFAFGV